jgi:hypothetical protein
VRCEELSREQHSEHYFPSLLAAALIAAKVYKNVKAIAIEEQERIKFQ